MDTLLLTPLGRYPGHGNQLERISMGKWTIDHPTYYTKTHNGCLLPAMVPIPGHPVAHGQILR